MNTLQQETAHVEGSVWVETRTSVQLTQEPCYSVVVDLRFQCMPRRIDDGTGGRRKAHSCRQIKHTPLGVLVPSLVSQLPCLQERAILQLAVSPRRKLSDDKSALLTFGSIPRETVAKVEWMRSLLSPNAPTARMSRLHRGTIGH